MLSRLKLKSVKPTQFTTSTHRAIDLGVASEAKYNEFVAKLKAAGSDKIIAEMQKQIDAWKTSK